MISIRDLSARANGARLDDISFSVAAGECVCVLAPDARARTLLADCLTGCAEYSGACAVCGIDLRARPLDAKAHMGYAPDAPALYPDMTARSALQFLAEAREIPKRDRARLIERALAVADMSALADTRAGTLSLANKRRLHLAQALLHDPEALVADNPTGGLDPRETVRMRDLLREITDGRAVLLVSGNMSDALGADRIGLLDQGRIAYMGGLDGLYAPKYADILRKTAGDWFDPAAFREA